MTQTSVILAAGSMAGLVSGLQVTKAAGLVESPIFQNPQEPFEDSKNAPTVSQPLPIPPKFLIDDHGQERLVWGFQLKKGEFAKAFGQSWEDAFESAVVDSVFEMDQEISPGKTWRDWFIDRGAEEKYLKKEYHVQVGEDDFTFIDITISDVEERVVAEKVSINSITVTGSNENYTLHHPNGGKVYFGSSQYLDSWTSRLPGGSFVYSRYLANKPFGSQTRCEQVQTYFRKADPEFQEALANKVARHNAC